MSTFFKAINNRLLFSQTMRDKIETFFLFFIKSLIWEFLVIFGAQKPPKNELSHIQGADETFHSGIEAGKNRFLFTHLKLASMI
jgi:hypothetical protein